MAKSEVERERKSLAGGFDSVFWRQLLGSPSPERSPPPPYYPYMSHPRSFQPLKLVIGCLFKDAYTLESVAAVLEKKLGKADFKLPAFSFHFSSYYEKEMGEPLWRSWIGFESLIKPSDISSVKKCCYEIEKKEMVEGKRQINLDPGFLSLHNFILTSFKNFAHRIPLGKSVYGDLTLVYSEKEGFKTLPWTYPDYKTDAFLKFLSQIRKKYRIQIRNKSF